MNLKNKEKVMLVMIPYLGPDFTPLALAMMKGILDQYGVDTKSRDFNTDVHEYFKNNEIDLLLEMLTFSFIISILSFKTL